MAHLIDKDALVAEIKARINDIEEAQKAGIIKKRDADMKIILFKSILSLINTFEVKEVQEEPVSEDLEEASKEWLRPQLDKYYANYGEGKMMELTRFDGYAMLDAIEFGAKWQMAQMIKDATDVTVHIDAGGYPYIPQMELYDYDKDIPLAKEGDKYKVILIKEAKI